jgi:hypothetical protein
VLTTLVRLLTFRLDAAGYAALGLREARVGLVLAWIAGIGRYWDHPTAGLAQKSGVGSVVYVLLLSALLWLVLRPMGTHRRAYWNVAAMVGSSSPLAWLYALPVERWTDVQTAIDLNIAFLAVVAVWRVLLYARYLKVGCSLNWIPASVCTLLPLCAIVTALMALNLEQAVFDLMGGLQRREGPGERVIDETYGVVVNITFFSWLAVLPLLIAYGFAIWRVESARR